MVAAALPKTMTIEEFAQITDDGHFDLVDGEVWHVAATGARHGKFGVRLARFLGNHVAEVGTGEVYSLEFGYVVRPDEPTVLCPDVSFLLAEHVVPDSDDFHVGPPDLAVEVISPSETSRRVLAKANRYIEAGTEIVWCVYPKKRQIVVYAADATPEILGVGDTLTGGSVLPDFALPLATLFEE